MIAGTRPSSDPEVSSSKSSMPAAMRRSNPRSAPASSKAIAVELKTQRGEIGAVYRAGSRLQRQFLRTGPAE
jgi:hypothetical protein